jgi:hypothetical protein
MTTPHQDSWLARYGAQRREIDRKILAALEAQIAKEERQISAQEHVRSPQDGRSTQTPPERLDQTARAAIARAFGRPPT